MAARYPHSASTQRPPPVFPRSTRPRFPPRYSERPMRPACPGTPAARYEGSSAYQPPRFGFATPVRPPPRPLFEPRHFANNGYPSSSNDHCSPASQGHQSYHHDTASPIRQRAPWPPPRPPVSGPRIPSLLSFGDDCSLQPQSRSWSSNPPPKRGRFASPAATTTTPTASGVPEPTVNYQPWPEPKRKVLIEEAPASSLGTPAPVGPPFAAVSSTVFGQRSGDSGRPSFEPKRKVLLEEPRESPWQGPPTASQATSVVPSTSAATDHAQQPIPEKETERRHLLEESQATPSEFLIIDYGHNSTKADLLCFDYDHGQVPRMAMQNRFSSHLDSMRWAKDDSEHERDTNGAVCKETVQEDEKQYCKLGEEFYYRLALDAMNQYVVSYEQSIWDYDPKFTWDYLPGTKRGRDEIKEFIVGKSFYDEETEWKKHKRTTEQVYAHEIAERKAILEKGESLYDEEKDKPISVRPVEMSDLFHELFQRFENEIGFPERQIQDEYCGICRISFQSVLSSVQHYDGPDHEKKVRKHFVNGLRRLGAISRLDQVPLPLEDGIINRGMKRYKIRPLQWMCELCNTPITSLSMAEMHFEGAAHQKRKLALAITTPSI